ncbi:MAG: hypothetical protein IPI23_00945 [Bacteroidetes bacterium]|nr:hypothetical protein [Bacteroidota bacterium]
MALKNTKTECAPLEWSQFLMLIDSLKKSNDYTFLLLVCVGGYCGLRLSDILQLQWSDILNKDQFELIEKKTGKHRKIGINPNLKDVIQYCFNQQYGTAKSTYKEHIL